jgi:transcriptional regulator with XRE-family HTH domain
MRLTPALCREIRERSGWTWGDLAERAGVAVNRVAAYERGFRTGARVRERIAAALEVAC